MDQQYLTYSVEELAADEAVQNYVLRGEQADAWESWLATQPDVAVRMLQAQRLVRELDATFATAPSAEDQAIADRLWTQVRANTAPPARVVGLAGWVQRREWGRLASVAMAAAAIILTVFYLLPQGDVYATRRGEIEVVVLPDNSRVTLAPASSLRVDEYEGERRVVLNGQAFFEVEKGSAFTVETMAGEVAVLGTSFDVNASPDGLLVACATGQVRVARDAETAELEPGESVSSRETSPGLDSKRDVAIPEIAAWRTGTLHFSDQRLESVFEDLERFYARDFSVGAELLDQRVTLSLPSDDFPGVIKGLSVVLQQPIDTSRSRVKVGY